LDTLVSNAGLMLLGSVVCADSEKWDICQFHNVGTVPTASLRAPMTPVASSASSVATCGIRHRLAMASATRDACRSLT
jgi:NADP-dependent 3-hydroxy acid dehydrogenase YdfG